MKLRRGRESRSYSQVKKEFYLAIARDHVVYFLPEKGVVFSGDLYLGDRIRYFRADEDMGTQIASLKKRSSGF